MDDKEEVVVENKKVGAPLPSNKAEVPGTKKVLVSFQQNRSFELHVAGSKVAEFGPYEAKLLPYGIVKHPDFLRFQGMGFFQVQEV